MGTARQWFGIAVLLAFAGCTRGCPAAPPPPAAPVADAGAPPPAPPAPVFQAGFHQALRLSLVAAHKVTFRMRLPVHRRGDRVRVVFRAGDGPLELSRATIAAAGTGGTLASEPRPLTFSGQAGFVCQARERISSDPLEFRVERGDELAVSLEVTGALATSKLANFPGSHAAWGEHAFDREPNGPEHPREVGVATLEVDGPPEPVVIAIGDSITEGYVTGPTTAGRRVEDGLLVAEDDYRRGWTAIATAAWGHPVLNAGVSDQGLWGAHEHLAAEVLAVPGVTDCLVFLGTNDLHQRSGEELIDAYARLLERLRPFCRVWAATLLPKERTTRGDYEAVKQRRLALNAWLRTQAPVLGVLDLDAVVRDPEDPHRFAAGFGQDGIHPTVAGQEALGRAAADFFTERLGR